MAGLGRAARRGLARSAVRAAHDAGQAAVPHLQAEEGAHGDRRSRVRQGARPRHDGRPARQIFGVSATSAPICRRRCRHPDPGAHPSAGRADHASRSAPVGRCSRSIRPMRSRRPRPMSKSSCARETRIEFDARPRADRVRDGPGVLRRGRGRVVGVRSQGAPRARCCGCWRRGARREDVGRAADLTRDHADRPNLATLIAALVFAVELARRGESPLWGRSSSCRHSS